MLPSLLCAVCLVSQKPPAFSDDFENAITDQPADGWFVPTAGYKATVVSDLSVEGKQSVRLEWIEDKGAPFGNFMRDFPASPFAGRHVKLSAKVRVESDSGGVAQMWLRVDRANEQRGAFDNMGNRPIRAGEWRDAIIEADIDKDAQSLNIGFMSIRHATVWVDAVRLEVGDEIQLQPSSPPRAVSPRGLDNLCAAARLFAYVRFFDPSDAAVGVQAWDHYAVDLLEHAEIASTAAELAKRLEESFAPISPTLQVWAGSTAEAPPTPSIAGEPLGLAHWQHVGAGRISPPYSDSPYSSAVQKERGAKADDDARTVVKSLAGGVCCRLAIRVGYDAGGTLPHSKTPEAWTDDKKLPRLTALNRATRLAGVASAWGIFQHFYPYFDVVETDWDAALPAALTKAAQDTTEVEYLATLRELVAKLHDGHGGVYGQDSAPSSVLPIVVEWMGRDLVIVGRAEGVPADVKIGDVVVSIDGRSAQDCDAELARWISAATEGWRHYRSQSMLPRELSTADPALFVLQHPDGAEYSAKIPREPRPASYDGPPGRPDNGSELMSGIVYFDLKGAEDAALEVMREKLDAATGIVFDMRGYPGAAAQTVLRRLAGEALTSARWNVPIVTLPDREAWTWNTSGRWNLPPIAPRWTMPVAFVTDGRAISYAESIMGIVENYKLGDIVGSETAGTNGNVNPFLLPGGYSVSWTGMKVLKHDGTQHHGVGIHPTVRVVPTPRGVADGRDEVLERAVEVLKARIAGASK